MNGVFDVYDMKVGDEKKKGVARLAAFDISVAEAAFARIRAKINGNPFRGPFEGKYISLAVNGELMMSDTQMELDSNEEFVKNAHGDVMIAGLGIGLILNALRPKVKQGIVFSITIYEKYQDVIDLVKPYYEDLPLTIICQDILEYKPRKDEMYDTIYFDIWPHIDTDNLDEIKMLHNRWKNHKPTFGWMDSWMKKFLQNRKRKERCVNYWGF